MFDGKKLCALFLRLINAKPMKLVLHSAEKRRERRREEWGAEFCQHLKPSIVMKPTAAIIIRKPPLYTQASFTKHDKYLVKV